MGPETEHDDGGPSVSRSVRLRLRIFAAIAVVAAGVVAVDLVRLEWSGTSILAVAGVGALGLVAGLVASRIYALCWDRDTAAVVGRIDALGAVVLVGYIALIVLRGRLLAIWIHGPELAAAGFAALAGIMLGQVVGTLGGVSRALAVAGPRAGKAAAVPPPALRGSANDRRQLDTPSNVRRRT